MKLVVLMCSFTAALLWRAECFPTGDPPMFTAVLEDTVVADPGGINGGVDSFSLQCQVTGTPTSTIAWFREGNEIEGETSTTLTVSPITGTDATIDGVQYYCEANNSFGRIRSRRANVQLATFIGWTVSGTRTIDARSGFSVAVPCTPPSANPPPIVFWQADGVNITAGDPLTGGVDDRVQVLPSGHLVIHQLEASDFAVSQYRCSVSNANTHSISQSPQMFTLNQVTTLPPNPVGTSLHVFNHVSVGQAERGQTFYFFNVVQPTMLGNIFSTTVPSIALGNAREIFIVNNVEASDAGRVEIRYFSSTDGAGGIETLGSLSTTISVIDPAEVTAVSGPHQAFTGRSVTLTCTIAAIPAATVMWNKDGIVITPGGSRSIATTPDTNTRLTIDSVTMDDIGMYQCFVSNMHGDDVGTISLQVRDHELEILQPLARETPFLEGNNRNLTVSVLSDTQPTMTWSVNGQVLTASNSTYDIGSIQAGSVNARRLTEYSRTLSVFFLNTTYEGEYKLVAEVSSDGLSVQTTGNVLQERLTNSITVTVVDSPCLVVGSNVTLRCQPDGVPRSTVTWFQANSMLSPSNSRYLISNDPDHTITIINVVQGDEGSYTCSAMNTLTNGTVSQTMSGLIVFGIACVIPTIAQATNDSVDLTPVLEAGAALTLSCTAMGTPRPQVNWYRGDSRIIINSRTQITDTQVPPGGNTLLSTLVISSLSARDSGTYECRAENGAGTTALQYQVSVTPAMAPNITQATDDSVDLRPSQMAGGVVTLTCTATGTPLPQINWYRGDSRIIINSRTHITEIAIELGANTLLSTLVISSVMPVDSGTYECRAESSAGTTSLQYQVTVVTSMPTIVQATDDNVDLSPTVVAGEALTLSCTVMGILSSRIDWYRGNSRVIIDSRTQITEIEVNATAQLSMLIISSTVEGDSGTYECRVESGGSTTALRYQVAVVRIPSANGGSDTTISGVIGGVIGGGIVFIVLFAVAGTLLLVVYCYGRKRGIPVKKVNFKAAPEGEDVPAREEEGQVEVNPAYQRV